LSRACVADIKFAKKARKALLLGVPTKHRALLAKLSNKGGGRIFVGQG
jgi:hypothetical protein